MAVFLSIEPIPCILETWNKTGCCRHPLKNFIRTGSLSPLSNGELRTATVQNFQVKISCDCHETTRACQEWELSFGSRRDHRRQPPHTSAREFAGVLQIWACLSLEPSSLPCVLSPSVRFLVSLCFFGLFVFDVSSLCLRICPSVPFKSKDWAQQCQGSSASRPSLTIHRLSSGKHTDSKDPANQSCKGHKSAPRLLILCAILATTGHNALCIE